MHPPFRVLRGVVATGVLAWVLVAKSETPPPTVFSDDVAEQTDLPSEPKAALVLPDPLPDPLEPVNRAVWGLNRAVMSGVIKPTARVYRFVVGKPIREGIGNVGRNLTYPGRLVNHLLQGRWVGARDETYRFLCNSVLGVGGFFDLANAWNIPKSDADFGQTFGRWGWEPHAFVMLPVFGPSNDRDSVGLAADRAADPLNYVSPYPVKVSNPWTYFGPYFYLTAGITYNNLSDSVEGYVRLAQSEKDPYAEIEYAWGFVRPNRRPDLQPRGEPDATAVQTLQTAFFTFKDPEFPTRSRTQSVLIPTTGRKLPFTFWIQKNRKAPLVLIVPGLGSHRLAGTVLALAELAYRTGYSVACVSNPFNYEFMERASTAVVPAYTPVDAHDLHVALTAVVHRLERMYPGQVGAKALLGYSMGAFQSLFIAGNAPEWSASKGLVPFDRYVAVDTPVRLLYGMSQLDALYQAPLAWPDEERTANIENTLFKVAALTENTGPLASLPFSGTEAKFLIGLTFRMILRDAIFSSQERHNQGVLQQPLSKWRRGQVYHEILQYSYREYFRRFVVPYYRSRGIDLDEPSALGAASDLRSHTAALRADPKVRVVVNRNDFLLSPSDLAWLQATFGSERLALFEEGGHLGNLGAPFVQEAILQALDGLGAGAEKPK